MTFIDHCTYYIYVYTHHCHLHNSYNKICIKSMFHWMSIPETIKHIAIKRIIIIRIIGYDTRIKKSNREFFWEVLEGIIDKILVQAYC